MLRLKVPELEHSKSILTKYDYDEFNVVFCILRAKFPQDQNSHFEILKRKYFKLFDFKTLQFPLSLKDIGKFLQNNKWLDITIKIILYHNGKCYPQQFFGNGGKIVHLIYVRYLEKNDCQYKTSNHYFLMKNPDAFLSNLYRGGKNRKKLYFCLNCLCKFPSEKDKDKHEKECSLKNRSQRVVMPKSKNNE